MISYYILLSINGQSEKFILFLLRGCTTNHLLQDTLPRPTRLEHANNQERPITLVEDDDYQCQPPAAGLPDTPTVSDLSTTPKAFTAGQLMNQWKLSDSDTKITTNTPPDAFSSFRVTQPKIWPISSPVYARSRGRGVVSKDGRNRTVQRLTYSRKKSVKPSIFFEY